MKTKMRIPVFYMVAHLNHTEWLEGYIVDVDGKDVRYFNRELVAERINHVRISDGIDIGRWFTREEVEYKQRAISGTRVAARYLDRVVCMLAGPTLAIDFSVDRKHFEQDGQWLVLIVEPEDVARLKTAMQAIESFDRFGEDREV